MYPLDLLQMLSQRFAPAHNHNNYQREEHRENRSTKNKQIRTSPAAGSRRSSCCGFITSGAANRDDTGHHGAKGAKEANQHDARPNASTRTAVYGVPAAKCIVVVDIDANAAAVTLPNIGRTRRNRKLCDIIRLHRNYPKRFVPARASARVSTTFKYKMPYCICIACILAIWSA